MRCNSILKKLKTLANPQAIAGMARYGINPAKAYGISIPTLRKMARAIGRDHLLAQKLWSSGIHEARILAGMIDKPATVSDNQMEQWVREFDSWDVCDQCCMNLFEKTDNAYKKAVQWSSREEEFIKRAGFVLMARLAVSDKKAPDEKFEQFFQLIKKEAGDSRNYVKKAVNWALRQIGKRNLELNRKAVDVARKLQSFEGRTERWIASDAIRELTGRDLQERLQEKSRKKDS